MKASAQGAMITIFTCTESVSTRCDDKTIPSILCMQYIYNIYPPPRFQRVSVNNSCVESPIPPPGMTLLGTPRGSTRTYPRFVAWIFFAQFLFIFPGFFFLHQMAENQNQNQTKIWEKSEPTPLRKTTSTFGFDFFDFSGFSQKAKPQKLSPRVGQSTIFTNLC